MQWKSREQPLLIHGLEGWEENRGRLSMAKVAKVESVAGQMMVRLRMREHGALTKWPSSQDRHREGQKVEDESTYRTRLRKKWQ